MLDGKKTNTRRVIKSLNDEYNIDSVEVGIDGHGKIYFTPYSDGKPTQDIYPSYQLEEVAIAQSYHDAHVEWLHKNDMERAAELLNMRNEKG